ncbi:hypothetical protein EJ07DRAFT_172230 [Lizonia empirigonia]|nr:hypothetical protein EJ07DRAFT_172230 [Lizonia empirigonia]
MSEMLRRKIGATPDELNLAVSLFYITFVLLQPPSAAVGRWLGAKHWVTIMMWQYLYIIEGGLTILLGTVAWFWLPHGLESAWFLSVEDRQFATERILQDNAGYMSQDTRDDLREKPTLSTRDVKETFRDWKLWYVLVFNICASVPSQAFSVFLPLVIQGLGYSSLRANLIETLIDRERCPYHHIYAEQRPCIYLLSAQTTTKNADIT